MSRPNTPAKTNSFSDLDRYDNTEISVTKDGQDRIVGRSVTLYSSKIATVRWDKGYLKLDHGGYTTDVTKRRMNEFLDVIDVSYYVRSVDGRWHLFDERDGKVVESFERDTSITFWL